MYLTFRDYAHAGSDFLDDARYSCLLAEVSSHGIRRGFPTPELDIMFKP
jgi:hypothetical protein